MRYTLILYFLPLFLFITFSLLAQDTSVSSIETETSPSQEVEDKDVPQKEQEEEAVVEDIIVDEESGAIIVDEESRDVIVDEESGDVIVDEESEEDLIEDVKEDIAEEVLEKEEPKEDVIVEEAIPVDDSKIDKADTAKSPLIAPKEKEIEEVEESVWDEEVKDTVSQEHLEKVEDLDIILQEDDELLIVDDEEELFIAEEPEESTVVEETLLKEKEDTTAAEVTPSEEISKPPEKEGIIVQPELEIKEEEISIGKPEVATDKKPGKGKPSKPVKIGTRSIDFAKNLKEYRSPKKAMFMSLLLPGLGQAYTKKYWKTALFGCVEAALIGFAVKHAIDGRDQKEEARNFADVHFIDTAFFNFYKDFEIYIDTFDVDTILIFGESVGYYENKYTGITGKNHDIDDRQDFDRDIGTEAFVQGWDDCEPPFDILKGYDNPDSTKTYFDSKYYFTTYNTSDTLWLLNMYNVATNTLVNSGVFGYSKNQNKYNHMISLSNHYYNVSTILLFFLVANHIASAVDAFISARAFNDKLLNKKSMWQHIDIDHQIAFAQDGFHSRLGVRVRF